MKIVYLIPPSEGKNSWGDCTPETLSLFFEKPYKIAIHATEKDLKCKWSRYEEGIELNKLLTHPWIPSLKTKGGRIQDTSIRPKGSCLKGWGLNDLETLPAISRYSGVMYNAINYAWMDREAQKYFRKHYLILSGMYGVLKPEDMIGNYKLPIETKGLYAFWDSKITDTLNNLELDYIVDFLPNSYKKMIDWKSLEAKVIRVDFFSQKNGEQKKMTHGVKKIKGKYIYDLCQKAPQCIADFLWEKVQISEKEYHIKVICD